MGYLAGYKAAAAPASGQDPEAVLIHRDSQGVGGRGVGDLIRPILEQRMTMTMMMTTTMKMKMLTIVRLMLTVMLEMMMTTAMKKKVLTTMMRRGMGDLHHFYQHCSLGLCSP